MLDSTDARQLPRRGRIVLICCCAWLLCVVGGALALSTTESSPGRSLAPGRALFLAASAATLTGFQPSWTNLSSAPTATQTIYTILVSVGVIACWVIGGLAVAHGWQRLRGIRLSLGDRDLALFLAGMAVVLLALSAAFDAWADRPWLDGLTVFAGAGLPSGPREPDVVFWTWYIPQAACGVLGPLFMLVAAYRVDERADPADMPTRQLHVSYAGMAIAFALSLVVLLSTSGFSATAAGLATDSRSSGFLDPSALPAAGRWSLVPLMLLGTAGTGTGGGLKVTTAAVLLLGLWRILRGETVGRTFAIALIWLLALAALFLATFLALIAVLPQLPADRIALLAAGACGTVGLSVDPVVASGYDAWILSIAMILGRALPWAVLWWSATRGDDEIVVG